MIDIGLASLISYYECLCSWLTVLVSSTQLGFFALDSNLVQLMKRFVVYLGVTNQGPLYSIYSTALPGQATLKYGNY
jgi:hypothetical protein